MSGTHATLTGRVTAGCGLAGAGTADAPVSVSAAAGEQPWPWTCDEDASTLHCDPTSGLVWTPPEHEALAAADAIEHFPAGIPPIGTTGGWVVVDPAAQASVDLTAGVVGECRNWWWTVAWTAHVDAVWAAGSSFEVGYILVVNGGAPQVASTGGLLDPRPAGRQWFNGTLYTAADPVPRNTAQQAVAVPAINITAGQVALTSWATRRMLQVGTRGEAA